MVTCRYRISLLELNTRRDNVHINARQEQGGYASARAHLAIRDLQQEKINLYFTVEFRRSLDLFHAFISLRTYPSLICNASIQFQMKIRKISGCHSRSPKNLELGHFTLLFCRGRLRNVQRIIMAQPLFCLFLVCGVLVAFIVVVCLRSLIILYIQHNDN